MGGSLPAGVRGPWLEAPDEFGSFGFELGGGGGAGVDDDVVEDGSDDGGLAGEVERVPQGAELLAVADDASEGVGAS